MEVAAWWNHRRLFFYRKYGRLLILRAYSSVVERCPDKTEVVSSILTTPTPAGVVKLADTHASEACELTLVEVQILSPAPKFMHDNREAWEREYQNFSLLNHAFSPTLQSNASDFVRWLRRERGVLLEGARVLDLGSGVGRNAIELARRGAHVTGLEFSSRAIDLARERSAAAGVTVEYLRHDVGTTYPFSDQSFDLAFDITCTNSLSRTGREVYLAETRRVLVPGGWLFVRALALDGDRHAATLLKRVPGAEPDTYVLPELGVTERVFRREDFLATYQPYFKVVELIKISRYVTFKGRKYKRNYWIAYLQKHD